MPDRHSRSIVKAISWRMTGTVDTVVISWLVTGKLTFAITIGSVELFTKIMLYYLHERMWDRISFGQIKNGPKEDFTI